MTPESEDCRNKPFVTLPNPNGPFGAKGLGECAMIPTAPAILNAIADAPGARITQLPPPPGRPGGPRRAPQWGAAALALLDSKARAPLGDHQGGSQRDHIAARRILGLAGRRK